MNTNENTSAHVNSQKHKYKYLFVTHAIKKTKFNLYQKQVTFSRAEQFGPIDHNHNQVRVNFDDDYTL